MKLVLQRGKDVIFAHIKNLRGSGISVNEQLPSEMRERRDVQFSKFKQLKNHYQQDNGVRVRLARDKLFINDKLVDNSFEKNSLPFPNSIQIKPIRFDDLLHTEVKEQSQSYFRGHLHAVNSIELEHLCLHCYNILM